MFTICTSGASARTRSALACHVTIADIPPSESACILARLNHVLQEHFHISHATIQFEHMGCDGAGRLRGSDGRDGRRSHSHHGHAH